MPAPVLTSRAVKPVLAMAVGPARDVPVPETSMALKVPAVTVPAVAAVLPVPSRLFALAPVMAADVMLDLVV